MKKEENEYYIIDSKFRRKDMREIVNNSTFKNYTLTYEWPEDCFVQGGSDGLVLSKKGNYTTSYFEAFPKNPNCFIRGEGETMEEAEKACFEKFQKFSSCKGHQFIRTPGYNNGMGTCTLCGLKSKVFKPSYRCVCCGKEEIEAYSTILPKYKKEEGDSICEECVTSKKGFSYLDGHTIHDLCNFYNGIILCNPIMDRKTFEALKTKPETLEEFLEICAKDSNVYLEESMKRMLTPPDEVEVKYPSLTHKVSSYDELYDYFYENYMKRWVERGYKESTKRKEEE